MFSRTSTHILSGVSLVLLLACDSRRENAAARSSVATYGGTRLFDGAANANEAGSVDAIQAFIDDAFYSDADIVHSFHTIFGERIDCIDFYAQHSVKSLIAAGQPISIDDLIPSNLPMPGSIQLPSPKLDAFLGSLDDDGNARRCSGTTVPTIRPTVADVQNAGGISAFLALARSAHPRDPLENSSQYDCYEITDGGVAAQLISTDQNYDHVAGYQHTNYTGALTITPVEQPFLDVAGDHSVSQLWVQTGGCESWLLPYSCSSSTDAGINEAVQSIEVGWIVGAPYSGTSPHLFAYTTTDGYYEYSCYANRACTPSGWIPYINVPTAPYTMGQTLALDQEISIQVWNGSPQSKPYWYIWINGQLVGAYPTSIYFGQMKTGASNLQVGGEVLDSWPGGGHTLTCMGSGIPPQQDYGDSAYHRTISLIEGTTYENASLTYISGLPTYEGDRGFPGVCGDEAGYFYNKGDDGDGFPPLGSGWGTYFYFGGGPGF